MNRIIFCHGDDRFDIPSQFLSFRKSCLDLFMAQTANALAMKNRELDVVDVLSYITHSMYERHADKIVAEEKTYDEIRKREILCTILNQNSKKQRQTL